MAARSRTIKLYHATTRQRLASIQASGLRVANADPAAKIKGVWLHSKSLSAWAIVHTQRKHKVNLEDVVIIEVNMPRGQLTRFRTGFYYSTTDVKATRLGIIRPGEAYGQSVSE
jgi:hypothetical protein